MDWSNVGHFTQKEWGNHSELVDPQLIFLLDAIRHEYGKPCIIHCAWASSGHSTKSYHYLGKAVDFHFEDNDYAKQFELISSFPEVGAIGFYGPGVWAHPGFHIDIRPVRLYWTERNGIYVYNLAAVKEDLNGK